MLSVAQMAGSSRGEYYYTHGAELLGKWFGSGLSF